MSEERWQPIETAPKDGTEILVAYSYPLHDRGRCSGVTCSAWLCSYWQGFHEPQQANWVTHWMPLPEPPVDAEAAC